jgi:PAS domain-containing protein
MQGSGEELDVTLDAFDRVGAAGEPLTTAEVTEALDCSRRTAYIRLQRLVERDAIDTKKVGARGRIWWRAPSSGDAAAESGTDTRTEAVDSAQPGVRKRGTQAHERERRRYEAVVETLGDGVYIVDEESRFVLVNDAHTELTGYDREELIGAHASLVTPDDDLAKRR